VGGQSHAPAAVPKGKTRYPLYRRLAGPQGRSARVQKIWPPRGFEPLTVQRVARINNNNNNNNNNYYYYSMENVEREILSVSLNKKKYLMLLTITKMLFFCDIG
jgi:pyocin large subunit-like protein